MVRTTQGEIARLTVTQDSVIIQRAPPPLGGRRRGPQASCRAPNELLEALTLEQPAL